MGEVELDNLQRVATIHSHIVTYGDAADEDLTKNIREEIETMWNEPNGTIMLQGSAYLVRFRITATWNPRISVEEVYANLDPRNNYFRVEAYALGNISFVDGLGCNSGYFLLENLYTGSTTAAHEYGHTLGLDHPRGLDIRGQGRPGIMYPRGTLVDPEYQYEPDKPAGTKGGTMHPMYRVVYRQDIASLRLDRLRYKNDRALLGEFTNVYHFNHSDQA